jgi:hypothetical protein
MGYEILTLLFFFRLDFGGEEFVVSHPFAKKPAKGWGTQFGRGVWGSGQPASMQAQGHAVLLDGMGTWVTRHPL